MLLGDSRAGLLRTILSPALPRNPRLSTSSLHPWTSPRTPPHYSWIVALSQPHFLLFSQYRSPTHMQILHTAMATLLSYLLHIPSNPARKWPWEHSSAPASFLEYPQCNQWAASAVLSNAPFWIPHPLWNPSLTPRQHQTSFIFHTERLFCTLFHWELQLSGHCPWKVHPAPLPYINKQTKSINK